ncbi:sensor histidine kinase [Halorientalis salina]|uniref:sensor histidine kinase n=1 Tax=Halorientalis salina TaxID=2932266 RepID=UPI0010AC2EC2|nr:HAMP domain-containing sensor histidine kinase [Halorientalis salina]
MLPADRPAEHPGEGVSPGTDVRQRFERLLATTPYGGPIVVGTVGAGLFLATVMNFLWELRLFGFQWPQVAAVVLSTWLSVILVYGAIYLAGTEFSARQRWGVAGATIAGLVIVYLTMYFTVVIRTSTGIYVGRPVLQLLASAHTGAIAGLVIGTLFVETRQDAREARQVGDQLEFMHSILRHDVLNSMTVVRARGEHLDRQLDGEYQESLDAILNQTESVIDLSQRARATVEALASDAEITPEPVDLSAVLREEIETVRKSYDDLSVWANVPDDVTVLADDMLAAVFGNLLGNAVHHNDADQPVVRVSAAAANDTVRVKVADNGPGIPDEKKVTVFRRGNSTSGGGFGLFFVRTMVEQYGGSVYVEDNRPRGAVFVVELPMAEINSAFEGFNE